MPSPTAYDATDTPATALGPTALVLGALSAPGAWLPGLALAAFPWAIITGGLAVTLGMAGVHCARLGVGRMWTATAGTTLGLIGLAGTFTLIWPFGG
ncbi:hypothetical protein ACWCP6_27400 [Streptomyces sp. NPDC002004]